jgi:hypothetical protein
MRPILMKGKGNPIEVDSKIVEVDTTDFNKIDYRAIYNPIRKHPD